MGNHSGCVSAPMDHDETANMDKHAPSTTTHSHSMSLSYSTSSVVERHPHPLPTCDEEHEIYDDASSSSHIDSHSLSQSATAHRDDVFKTNLKILFLDVDGVLNNPSTLWDDAHCGIDDEKLKYLKFIVLRTGCKIVLSTTWRLSADAKAVLLHTLKTRADLNIDDLVIGQTPSLKKRGGHRTHEIAEYLRANAFRFNVVSWCALDDLSLHKYDDFSAQFLDGHFVRTDKRIGLTPQNTMQCVSTLNAHDNDYNPYRQVHRERAYFAH